MPPVRRVALLLATAGAVAACASSAAHAPGWRGAPANNSEQDPVQIQPILPPQAGGSGSGSGGGGGSSSPSQGNSSSPSPRSNQDPFVVAKRLVAPTALAILPDGTAIVGERTTGKIIRVRPEAGKPTPAIKTINSIDPTGDGGLLDLALSPHYGQDNLVYAYITTRTDNRVVEFTLSGPVTPVLSGIPKGRTGNVGRIAFGADGDLYVGTGDAGQPSLAADPKSLAGKVLRITDIGGAAPGNPTPSSPVFTRGHHGADGLCADLDARQVLEVEAQANRTAEVNLLTPGSSYGWPVATSTSKSPAAMLPSSAASPGGCAVHNHVIFVTSLDGKRLLAAPLTGSGRALKPTTFRLVIGAKYGRLRTAVAAPDGAIWLTTSNRDGHGRPIADDERVIRIPPRVAGGGVSPV